MIMSAAPLVSHAQYGVDDATQAQGGGEVGPTNYIYFQNSTGPSGDQGYGQQGSHQEHQPGSGNFEMAAAAPRPEQPNYDRQEQEEEEEAAAGQHQGYSGQYGEQQQQHE